MERNTRQGGVLEAREDGISSGDEWSAVSKAAGRSS